MCRLAVRVLVLVAALGAPACSSNVEAPGGGDDERVVPEGLAVRALEGGNGVLALTALTLQQGSSGPELFVAVHNDGAAPACSAAVSVELFDRDGQSLAAGIGGLLTQRFYRLADGSGAVAACVGPGDVTIAAVNDLPADLAIDDVATVVYRCPYFALDVEPIAGLRVRDLERVKSDAGAAYAGTLVNELDVAVSHPSVTVFALNRAGRPLAMAVGSDQRELAPAGRWSFETGAIGEPGAGYAAYPAGALVNPEADPTAQRSEP